MTTTTTQAELFKIQSEINSYVAQKENLYKLLKDSQTAYDIDLKNIGYSFESVSNLTPTQKKAKNLEKYGALKEYFTKNYNENTKMRNYYFSEIDKLNVQLTDQETELAELAEKYQGLTTDASTDYRRLKDEKYRLAQQEYYYHLFVVCTLVQLLVFVVIALVINKSIPKFTGLVVLIIGIVLLTVYIVYYVYFKSAQRDPVVFDKYRFPIKSETVLKSKVGGEKSDIQRKREQDIDTKLAGILSDTQGKCPVYLESPK
jgi:lipopolysaccharide export LptBFGC system permease protein LptF